MTKPQTIAASDARNNFSDLVSKVQYQKQEFWIERYGEVVAKIVPVETKEGADNLAKTDTTDSIKQEVAQQQASSYDQPKAQERQDDAVLQIQQAGASKTAQELEELRARYQRMTMARRTAGSASYSQRTGVVQSRVVAQTGIADSGEGSTAYVGTNQDQVRPQGKQEDLQDSSDKDSAGWSALKKLEELIAAQKVENAQGERASKINMSAQVGQNDVDQSSQDSVDQPEIIRKKIEL